MAEKTANEIFGANLKRLRKIIDISGEALGYAIGYKSSGRISQIESGYSEMPMNKKIKAAEVLGVHPDILLINREMSDDELELYVYIRKLFTEKQDQHHINFLKTYLKTATSD